MMMVAVDSGGSNRDVDSDGEKELLPLIALNVLDKVYGH